MLELKNTLTGKTYYAIISEDKATLQLFAHGDNNDLIITRIEALRNYEPVRQEE